MPTEIGRIKKYLKGFDFDSLFIEELGWDNHDSTLDVNIDGTIFELSAIAHKRGFVAYLCEISQKDTIPLYQLRRKIENKVVKSIREHVIIFTDSTKTRQIWQWVKREVGKPTACREHHYYSNQTGEAIAQKLHRITFTLEEEETLTTPDVAFRVKAGLDVEKITKRFYDIFKKEHAAFLKFITGIPDKNLHEWYASVMLNRLMFIYFIQKKDFLHEDQNYLANKLGLMKQKGKDIYYKEFLCPLFFEGFAKPSEERKIKFNRLFGSVPYLNGGIFQKHQIEQIHGKTIQVPDKAFERIYEFFNAYQWHLDERPMHEDNEINPDVLGYIFEKYINQKQMGAYYTKEDITGYISRNTIIPRIFDMAREKCKIAFEEGQLAWRLLIEDPDRYIFEAVKKGCDTRLPGEIAVGINNISKRDRWNTPADEEYALPTEIWRETVARRQRYEALKSKIEQGQINSINDLITYNLDIRQFAQDVIENCEGPELLRAMWRAIVGRIPRKSNEKFQQGISILDPTCGSGAFLFTALNILEPLYEACINRMQAFVDELKDTNKGTSPEKYSDFKKILAEVKKHHNQRYFIYKSIIINNLFGVDIMEEAVEICKLRLFLKLVAQVETVADIEPLPDIDFNIRAGNTLVGFTSLDEVKKSMEGDFIKLQALPEIEEKAQVVNRAYQRFRQMQVSYGMDTSDFTKAKEDLNRRLAELEDQLNGYLSEIYGINPDKKNSYNKWLASHMPFHWFIEFYKIIESGGFDVIIGNPPYLEKREVEYTVRNLQSVESGAIHAMCIERSLQLLQSPGCISLIVPLALVSTQRMKTIQKLLESNRITWYSNYSWRPGKLFDTVNRALTIFVSIPGVSQKAFSTNYQKWGSGNRNLLMYQLSYAAIPITRKTFWAPKFGHDIEQAILAKCLQTTTFLNDFIRNTPHKIYYRTTGGLYWKIFTNFSPLFKVNGKEGHSSRETSFSVSQSDMVVPIIATLSSDIFWWWYTITTNCRDLNPSDILNFPVPKSALDDSKLISKGRIYLEDISKNSSILARNQKQTGKTETQSFKILKSKPIINEIDRTLAVHYGFTEEELDFLINYDIKYRMGKELNNNEEHKNE